MIPHFTTFLPFKRWRLESILVVQGFSEETDVKFSLHLGIGAADFVTRLQ